MIPTTACATLSSAALICAAAITAPAAVAAPAAQVDAAPTTYVVHNTLSGVDADVLAHFTVTNEGTAEGNLGCNTFKAEFTRTGNTATFTPIMQTRMICEPEVMDAEHTYSNFFSGTVRLIELPDRFVWLTDNTGRSLFAFAK